MKFSIKSARIIAIFFLSTLQIYAQFPEGTPWLERPFPKSCEKFTYAILGDKTTGGENNWPIFDRAVDEINLLRPDFVIMIGDLIQGYVTDKTIVDGMWQEFTAHAQRLQVPFFILPGNHDISNEMMYDYWEQHMGLRYYAFVYQNSLFLLLNSEEYKKTQSGQLGEAQLAFIKNELEKHKTVNQVFLFMHKPMWDRSKNSESLPEEWQTVLSWLKNRKATVFVGHRHNLLYQEIDGHRHITVSATGGELQEKSMEELGYFHHFTLVTVEPDTATIAIIKPGHIFPQDIANPDFITKAKNTIAVDSKVAIDAEHDEIQAHITFKFNNPLDKALQGQFEIKTAEISGWHFAQEGKTAILEPGFSAEYTFIGSSVTAASVPFPFAEFTITANGDTINEGDVQFTPGEEAGWHSPTEVLVLGAVDMGIKRKPRPANGLLPSATALIQPWGPELDFKISRKTKTSQGVLEWKNLKVTDGKIDFDVDFRNRDFSVGFVHFLIQSPEERTVFAALRPDNFAKVYLNREALFASDPLHGVPPTPYIFLMQLKKGQNEVLIKTADYHGSWYMTFSVIDPQKELRFKTAW
ncbi:MAG: metallophosphoesterase [Deferribacteres bacterium]|nr:metallophosphoesterase [Deferribacteres bacterium]